jgi:hypothetical protein
MPRGSNPNSHNIKKLNASRTQKEREKAASEAGKKSGESRKYLGNARKALKEELTDEEMHAINEILKKRAKSGNLTAIKMILDYTDEKQEQTVNNEITINLKKDDWDEYSN